MLADLGPKDAAGYEDGIAVYFGPNGHYIDAIVEQIDGAKSSVQVQAYKLSAPAIVEALVAAQDRGVMVTIVLDKHQQSDEPSDALLLHSRGMIVFIKQTHEVANNNVMIIDASVVVTGSLAFSETAESGNAENLLIIKGKPQLATAYQRNYVLHLQHLAPYEPPQAANEGLLQPELIHGDCCVTVQTGA